MKNWKTLRRVICTGKRLVVFLHDNPDPDALAPGWILQRLGEKLGLRSVIVYGGRLGRAENRAMVRLLKIPARSLESRRIRYLRTDRYALLDTQPGTGNNSRVSGNRDGITAMRVRRAVVRHADAAGLEGAEHLVGQELV